MTNRLLAMSPNDGFSHATWRHRIHLPWSLPATRRRQRLRLWRSALVGLAITWSVLPLFADDVVKLSRAKLPGETQRRGTIVDYNGESLVLALPGGREEQIPSERVIDFETTLVADQQNGDRSLTEGRFADAVVSYRRAVEMEKRPWMRRIILARLARCYANLDQTVRAGEAFLIIVRSDPNTQLFDAAPLTWTSRPPASDLAERSGEWLVDEDQPAARLLGASWLLATARRQDAIDELKRLTRSEVPRIAMLAQAQLWRNDLVTASMEDIREWQNQLARFDDSLRAGPSLLLGQALARHGQHQAAALALMRVPVLYPGQFDLAGECLFAAGEAFDKSGDPSGSRTVYRELVRNYKNHRLAPVAQQRLERTATN